MIATRARGLANLTALVMTLCIALFFWIYTNLIYHVPFVRLGHEVNLIPYFLCVIGGMILSVRDLSRFVARFHLINFTSAIRLASRQVVVMALLIFTMMFATQDHGISRLFLGSFLVWSWVLLACLNAALPGFLARRIFQKGQRLPTVFVGSISSFSKLEEWIAHKEPLGIDPVGILSRDARPEESALLPAPWMGSIPDLARILPLHSVAQVVLLELPATDDEAKSVIEACRNSGCRLLIHSNIEGRYSYPLVPITEEGRHFYTLQEEPLEDPLNRLMKRAYDIALSLPVVVFILPPMCALIAGVQRIQAPGPLFHARERRGKQGRVFCMLKFRSMYTGPRDDNAESRQVISEDERVYPLGQFLRHRSLDEFPQFWNVLKGEMSIVGPRPYMPLLDAEFQQQMEGYRIRTLVKPGITGLAQSMGYRGAVLEEEMLRRRVYWDVHYISHWSLLLDLQITVRTLWQVFSPPRTAF